MLSGKYNVRLDKMSIIDFELTCYEGEFPPGEEPEIIEVGIADIDFRSRSITQADSFYVTNTRSNVSPYCTSITGITQKILDKQGRPLEAVSRTLRKKYGTASKASGGWGNDNRAIIKDCIAKGVENPFSAIYYNFGALHSMLVGSRQAIGLMGGLDYYGLKPIGRHHSGKDDAIELARFVLEFQGLIQSRMPSMDIEEDTGYEMKP